MVSGKFGRKHARVSFQRRSKLHETEDRALHLTSLKSAGAVCFSKLEEKQIYTIYIKKIARLDNTFKLINARQNIIEILNCLNF
jgi:hypothetical protein